jgi:hypothetical protein
LKSNWFAAIGAVLAWSAVLLQFYLFLLNRDIPVGEVIFRFFTFFTILTNTCVAVMFSSKAARTGSWFNSASTSTAVTVYITVVGLTYNLLLRQLWEPHGMQRIVDELLHSLIPVYCVIYWLVFVPKAGLHYRLIPSWMIYPALYLAVILLRGHFSGWYPYPFVDAGQLGYQQVLINSGGMMLGFIVLSFLFIWRGRLGSKTS